MDDGAAPARLPCGFDAARLFMRAHGIYAFSATPDFYVF